MSRCRTEKQKRADLRNDLEMFIMFEAFRDPSGMYWIDRTSEVTSCLSLNPDRTATPSLDCESRTSWIGFAGL